MAIGRGENRFLISSDAEVLREEFKITDIIITKDNEIVRIDSKTVNSSFIGASEAKVLVKLKPGVQHYFI
jgi:hypothetical protein